jgi:ABC-type bacteriocin/lantibiotic exporter with double-glycine peptidase domain
MTIIHKIFIFLPKKYKKTFFFYYLSNLISIILDVVGIGILLPILNLILKKKTGITFFDNYFTLNNISFNNSIIIFLFIIIIIFILKNILVIYINIYQSKYISNLSYGISKNLFEKYLFRSISDNLKNNKIRLLRDTSSEVFIFSRYVILSLILILVDVTLLTIFIFLIIGVTNINFIIIFILFILVSSIIYFLNKKKLIEYGRQRAIIAEDILRILKEGFDSIREIKIYGIEKYFVDKYEKATKKVAPLVVFENLIGTIPKVMMEIFSLFLFVLIILLTLLSDRKFIEEIPNLTVLVLCIFRIAPSITRILQNFQKLKHYMPSFYNLKKIYEDHPVNDFELQNQSKILNKIFFENICLKNISFNYGKKVILNNINIDLKAGSKILIFGKSGVGKSTLLDLIVGFVRPTRGSILLNNQDTTFDHFEKISNLVSYVSQTTFFLDTKLTSNIALGQKDINIQKILSILEIVELKDFAEELKLGVDRNLGEEAKYLSGGQRQRIALARALYFEPKILILDEATNSLDYQTELKIYKNILDKYRYITLIFVSHSKNNYENIFEKYDFSTSGLKKI